MTEPSTTEVICPACFTPGAGRFCSGCGAALELSTCAACNTELSPGARFCHKCGRPTTPQRPSITMLPWIVATMALVALAAFFSGSALSRRGTGPDASRSPISEAGPGSRGSFGASVGTPVRAPDISQLSPQERADRLFNRVMLLSSQGKRDSVIFFAPMAIDAYQLLAPLNADQRYDMGRVAEVAGVLPITRAQSDTILAENPTHLLGLILGARVASLEGNTAARKSFETRIISAHETEMAKRYPEYERHADDIASALGDARRSLGTR